MYDETRIITANKKYSLFNINKTHISFFFFNYIQDRFLCLYIQENEKLSQCQSKINRINLTDTLTYSISKYLHFLLK